MGFLSGRGHLDIPPNLQTRGYSNNFVSEAGRVWGNAFRLGCPECVAEPRNILTWRQAGFAYWVDKNGYCQLVSLIWIEKFTRGGELNSVFQLVSNLHCCLPANKHALPRIRFPFRCNDITRIPWT